MNQFSRNLLLWALISLAMVVLFNLFNQPYTAQQSLAYSDFLAQVDKGEVKDVRIQGHKIFGQNQAGQNFETYAPNDPALVNHLLERNVGIKAEAPEEPPLAMSLLISWFPMLLLIGVWIFFMRQMQGGGGKAMSFGRSRARMMTQDQTKVTFADVAGVDEAKEELAEDIEGLQLGFQRVKIPSGGQLQFELPGEDPDNPDYSKTLEGVIVYSHNASAYWPTGEDYDDSTPPSCQSTDGKVGYGAPGGLCTDCPYNRYGSDTKGTGKGKACKNQRVIYLLRSGEAMPIQLSLSPTSIRPYTDFVKAAFVVRQRGILLGDIRMRRHVRVLCRLYGC